MKESAGWSDDDDLSAPGEINVTPLVDVMLVLLVIFMVTAPLLATGLKVDLPKTNAAKTLSLQQPVIVALSPDGSLAVGTTNTTPEGLVAAVETATTGDKSRSIQLRGDDAARYGQFVDALGRLAAAGYANIAIEAKPDKAGNSSAANAPAASP